MSRLMKPNYPPVLWYLLNHDEETVPVRKRLATRQPIAYSLVVSHLPSAGPVSTRRTCSVHARHTQVTAPTVKRFLWGFPRQEKEREKDPDTSHLRD